MLAPHVWLHPLLYGYDFMNDSTPKILKNCIKSYLLNTFGLKRLRQGPEHNPDCEMCSLYRSVVNTSRSTAIYTFRKKRQKRLV